MVKNNDNIEITIGEAKDVIKDIFERQANIPILLEGPSGIGKTAISRQIAHENKWEYIDVRMAGMLAEDVRGIPRAETWTDLQARKALEGKLKNLSPEVEYVLLSSFRKAFELKGPSIVDFEEINRAPMDARQPIFQLISDWMMDDRILHPEVRIIASINPGDDGRYAVYSSDQAWDRRWLKIKVIPHIRDFIKFAKEAEFFPGVINYLKEESDMLYSDTSAVIITPATWERVSSYLKTFTDKNSMKKLALKPLQLMLGTSTGTEMFETALRVREKELAASDIIDRYYDAKDLQKLVLERVNEGKVSELASLAQSISVSISGEVSKNILKFILDVPPDAGQMLISNLTDAEFDQTDPVIVSLMVEVIEKLRPTGS